LVEVPVTSTATPYVRSSPEDGSSGYEESSPLSSSLSVAAPSLLSSLLGIGGSSGEDPQPRTTTPAPQPELPQWPQQQQPPPLVTLINNVTPLVRQYWPLVEPYVRQYLPGLVSGLMRNVVLPGATRMGDFFKTGVSGIGQNVQGFLSQILPGIFPPPAPVPAPIPPSYLPGGLRKFDEVQPGQEYGYVQQQLPQQQYYRQQPSQDFNKMYQYAEYPRAAGYEDPMGGAYEKTAPELAFGARPYAQPAVPRPGRGYYYDQSQPAVPYQQYPWYDETQQPQYPASSAGGGADYGHAHHEQQSSPAGLGRSFVEEDEDVGGNGTHVIAEDHEEEAPPTLQPSTSELGNPASNATISLRSASSGGATPYGRLTPRSSQDSNNFKVRWFSSSRFDDKFGKKNKTVR
jgi:hypothetical protein